jgi:hypothetical protein
MQEEGLAGGAWRARTANQTEKALNAGTRGPVNLRGEKTQVKSSVSVSWAHHFGGHFYDEAARGEAFGLKHQAVEGAGDDVGFSAGEGF